jgi:hypothetical protein
MIDINKYFIYFCLLTLNIVIQFFEYFILFKPELYRLKKEK